MVGVTSTQFTYTCTSFSLNSDVLIHFASVTSNGISTVSHEFTYPDVAAPCSGVISGPVVSILFHVTTTSFVVSPSANVIVHTSSHS